MFSTAAHRINHAGLLSIAHSPTPKSEHLILSIKLQWNTLVTYFGEQEFNQRVAWVRDHLPTITELASKLPCFCPYKTSFKRALGRIATLEGAAEREGAKAVSATTVIIELIADLHNQAGSTLIQRLIKSSLPFIPKGRVFQKRRFRGFAEDYSLANSEACDLDELAWKITETHITVPPPVSPNHFVTVYFLTVPLFFVTIVPLCDDEDHAIISMRRN